MEKDDNADLNEEEKDIKPLKPKWWKSFWLISLILMIGSGIISYFVIPTSFIHILSTEFIFLLIFGLSYYMRIRPSKKVNKAIYITLGITPIGFISVMIYAFTIARFLDKWINLIVIIILLTIGGFFGNWIGKKRDYTLPLSP